MTLPTLDSLFDEYASFPDGAREAFAFANPRLLALASVETLGLKLAEKIVAERELNGPYEDMPDLARRTGADAGQLGAAGGALRKHCRRPATVVRTPRCGKSSSFFARVGADSAVRIAPISSEAAASHVWPRRPCRKNRCRWQTQIRHDFLGEIFNYFCSNG